MASRAARSVEPCDLGAAPATRADFPGLDRIGARLARGLSAVLAASGGSMHVTSDESRTMTLRDWKASLPPHVAIARYRDAAIKTGLLLSVSPPLIAALIDIFYGGDGASEPARVVFGAAEHRLFDRLAQGAGDAIAAGWGGLAPLAPALTGTVFAAEDVALGKPDDPIVVQQFAVGGQNGGENCIAIVYPLAALRSVMDLQSGNTDCAADSAADEPDPVWQRRLSDAVMQARLPMRTVIARPTVPLARLMSLAPGDFIPVTLPARVPLTVAGRLLAHGTIGEANGRAAIMIDRIEPGALDD